MDPAVHLPAELLQHIFTFISSSKSAPAVLKLREVSKTWAAQIEGIAFTGTPQFWTDDVNLIDFSTKMLQIIAVHAHCDAIPGSDWLSANAELTAKLNRAAAFITCLQVTINNNTESFQLLQVAHPNLRKLCLRFDRGTHSTAPKNGESVVLTCLNQANFPQLCSLHLENPTMTFMASLSKAAYLPPLVEFCVTYNDGQQMDGDPLATICTRLAPTLKTLIVKCTHLGELSHGFHKATLPNLEDLALISQYDEGSTAFPIRIIAPKVKRLYLERWSEDLEFGEIDFSTVTVFIDKAFIIKTVDILQLFPVVETLVIDNAAEFGEIKAHLKTMPAFCPYLTLIKYLGKPTEVAAETFERGNHVKVVMEVEPFNFAVIKVFQRKQIWGCDGCSALDGKSH
ncbi:hypothetical protein FRC17_007010 [Serendipita sp. 399]|nr:hypothetical protein FRC17_007010 [Serendipita sp. 399]